MTEDDYKAKLVSYPPEEILDYTIQELVEEACVHFYLPYQWTNGDGIGNPRPENPLTIYWTADVTDCDQRVTYKSTLGTLLDDTFELHELWNEGQPVIGSESVPLFVDIRDALLREVGKIDLWISNAVQEKEND
jgi:hypothetical protein